MSALVQSTVTVSLVVLCALAVAASMRRRPAAFRHWLIAAAMMCALVSPLLETIAPAWHLPHPSVAAIDEQLTFRARVPAPIPGTTSNTSMATPPVNTARPVVLLWIAGATISFTLLLFAMLRLRLIALRARPVTGGRWIELLEPEARKHGLRRRVLLLQSEHPTLLVTWGLVTPKILLPAAASAWPDDRIRVVLSHELAHVARWDWASQMLGELLRSIYWFNPLLWLACRQLRRECEHACDDAVLNAGLDSADYATHLLDLARTLRSHSRWFPVPAMASPSSLERRIRVMLQRRHNREAITRATRLGTLVTLFAITVLIAGASAQTFATVSGSIVDSQGAFLKDARLVLSNVQTRAKYEVRSSPTGQFEFLGVTPGDYVLEAVAPGFKSSQQNFSLVGGNTRRDIRMSVGTLEETITVTGPGKTPSAEDIFKSELFSKNARLKFQQTVAECQVSGSPAGPAIGGQIRPPRKIRDVRPRYPESARSAGIGGTAKLVAVIGPEGTVTQVQSVDQAVHPDLVDAAIEAVKQWEFDGTLLNCVPIEVEMTVSVGFTPGP